MAAIGAEYKRPKRLTVSEEECVCHHIKEVAKNVATAEVRITIHTDDGRSFGAVMEVELYVDD